MTADKYCAYKDLHLEVTKHSKTNRKRIRKKGDHGSGHPSWRRSLRLQVTYYKKRKCQTHGVGKHATRYPAPSLRAPQQRLSTPDAEPALDLNLTRRDTSQNLKNASAFVSVLLAA